MHLQCVLVVLGVKNCRHSCHGDAGFNLRGHQGVGQLGTEQSDMETGHLLSDRSLEISIIHFNLTSDLIQLFMHHMANTRESTIDTICF